MISEAQQRLAHRIAVAGIWSYSQTVELLENRSGIIEHFKTILGDMRSGINQDGIERAYCYGRFAEEIGATSYGAAFVYYLRRGSTNIKSFTGDLPAKVREKSSVKITVAQQEAYILELPAFEQTRREYCMQDDPFRIEWEEEQRERILVAAFLRQTALKDYEAFKLLQENEE